MRPTWAEIDLNAIRHNLREIRKATHPQSSIIPVVKGNAYGHGVLPVTRTLLSEGIGQLAVALPEEGIFLRRHDIKEPILILGLTLPEQAQEIVAHDLWPTIATWECAQALSVSARQLGKQARIFLKLDTGMHRVGLQSDQIAAFIERFTTLDHVSLQGVFTHFALADIRDKTYTRAQFAAFRSIISVLEQAGIHIPLKSAANSGAIIDLPDTHLDFVRPGITLYGLSPSSEVAGKLTLQPAMQFKSRIAYLKKVPRGSKIGYGCTYTTQQDAMIATLPVGYADGYSRLLSNRGEVLIHSIRCPVVGRVCMDQIMVDVSLVPAASIGDEAVLFGKQGQGEITIDEVAALIGTISYEIVCGISDRVPRIYLGGKQEIIASGTQRHQCL